jgi:predicted TIM-barrel fold metal-dependent hydrolase
MRAGEVPWIVSVDDHVIEPPDLFESRLPAKFLEQGPKVVRLPWQFGGGFRSHGFAPAASGPETDFWQVEDIHFVIPTVEVAAGMAPDQVTRLPISFADMRPGCYQAQARLRDMDDAKIERSLCFPNSVRFAGQLFLWMDDKELALACVRAYNDFIVDEWAGESGGRLIPLCLIPLWDPALAAAEVRRNAARGVRAVTFTELPALLDLPSIHDKHGHWLPFIDACDETGTVICMHIGSSSTVASSSDDAPGCVRMTTVNFNAQLAFTDWMFSGLLARYPNLKLAFSESQIGWMPYVLERMDRIWRMGNEIARIDPAIVDAPSSYMAGRVFGCFFEDDYGIANRDEIGIDQITFESDYPHQDSTWPHTHEYLTTALAGLSDDEVAKIARGNAIRMLGLEPELSIVEEGSNA